MLHGFFIYSKFFPKQIPALPNKGNHNINNYTIFKLIITPLFLILLVLGSILFGIATPSESAALGAVGATFISFYQNKLNFENLKKVADESLKISSMVFFILIGASLFSLVFRGYGGDRLVEDFLTNIPGGPNFSLFLVMITIFFLGFFLDFLEIIFVIIPIIAPALISLGFDPIWLGIIIAVNIQTSFLTPPFGFALFYLRGVAKKTIRTEEIYRGVIPFIFLQITLMIILFKFPIIVKWLPDLL